MRALVVGGAGVVGSHLAERLLQQGHEVVVVDDLTRGSFANVAHMRRSPRFAFVEHDVAKPYRAEADAVFHLAVPSTRRACEPDPARAVLTCVLGTQHALEAARAGGARLVLATSTERWGEGVRCAESLARETARAHGNDVRLVRLPSSYGPRMAPDGNHLVMSLLLQALRGERFAPGVRLERRVRLTYVDDAVETLMATMESVTATPILVGSSEEVSVGELARLIGAAAGCNDLEVAGGDGPASIPMPMSVRPTVAEALPASVALGLGPAVGLAEGIARTVAWFQGRTLAAGRERASGIYLRKDNAAQVARRSNPDAIRAAPLRAG